MGGRTRSQPPCPGNYRSVKSTNAPDFVGPSEADARDLIDAMTVEPTDVLVASDLLSGSVLAGEAAGLPTAILATNVSLCSLPGQRASKF